MFPKLSFISNINLLLVVPSAEKRLFPSAKYTSLSIDDLIKTSFVFALVAIVAIKLVVMLLGFPIIVAIYWSVSSKTGALPIKLLFVSVTS